mmetsp:Transcript_30638/g.94738  ORF Transcript_30638/g.94738 Transcript_30638/m.94738 type:complete len:290 (-) Transcript_30638:80-949(-)
MLRMVGRRALARRPPRPFASDARSGGWTNWAGNVSVARLARAVERPSSEPMLAQLVGSARRARVVGAGHSWSTVAGVDGSDCHVMTLEHMASILGHDLDAMTVTVQPGLHVKDLIAHVDELGWSLPNISAIDTQQVGGVLATSTHGGGVRNPLIPQDWIHSCRLVDGRGDVHELKAGRDEDVLRGVRGGLGTLGVISEVTIQCEPLFHLGVRCVTLSEDELCSEFGRLNYAHDFVTGLWLPHAERAAVYLVDKVVEGCPAHAAAVASAPVDRRALDAWQAGLLERHAVR